MFIRDLCGRFDIAKVSPCALYIKRCESGYLGVMEIVPKGGGFGTIFSGVLV